MAGYKLLILGRSVAVVTFAVIECIGFIGGNCHESSDWQEGRAEPKIKTTCPNYPTFPPAMIASAVDRRLHKRDYIWTSTIKY